MDGHIATIDREVPLSIGSENLLDLLQCFETTLSCSACLAQVVDEGGDEGDGAAVHWSLSSEHPRDLDVLMYKEPQPG
jgi:hypothetical protein